MPLSIECENGHKLVCPDSMAGSSVICPQCGSRVDVSARNVAKGGRAVSESAKASISDIQKRASAGRGEPRSSSAGEIAFTCPNGHRLNGPRSLQGKEGECPKCGVKFRVPPQEDQVSLASPANDDDEISLEGIEEIDLVPVAGRPIPRDPPLRSAIAAATAQESRLPILEFFAGLWQEREHGGQLELHLGDGVIVAPDWWSERQSNDEFGFFALHCDEGTYDIHAIAWSHVRRVTVRGLTELPGGLFEPT